MFFFPSSLFQIFHKVILTFCFYLCAIRKLQPFEITELWAAREKTGSTHSTPAPPKGNKGVRRRREGAGGQLPPEQAPHCTIGLPQDLGDEVGVCVCVCVCVCVSCDEEKQDLWSCLPR